MELNVLAREILYVLNKEDLEYDFQKGGMYRGKCKASEIQTNCEKNNSWIGFQENV